MSVIYTIFMKKRIMFLCLFTVLLVSSSLRAEPAMANIKSVNVGGFPIAMELSIDGAVVDEVGFVKTAAGNATLANKLQKGDTITAIDGEKVSGCDDVIDAVEGGDGAELELTLIRSGKEATVSVVPYIETDSGAYKLGVYIRDTISGIGTVTYVKENGYFGALGHKITDSVAGDVPISGGEVYECEILGIDASKRNAPGEIRAAQKGDPIGEIYDMSDFGIFGKLFAYSVRSDPVSVGTQDDVTPGKAYIMTTLDGLGVYEVEIIKAYRQSEAAPKGMFLRVTDKRLLGIAGGIVQGMSGSPILQKGKLIGAVTHVLVNDPAKGFAIYADWMMSA